MSKMTCFICVVCLCSIISSGISIGVQSPVLLGIHTLDTNPPLQFPKIDASAPKPVGEFPKKEIDVSTPIIMGDDPKKSKLPPKVFPSRPDESSAGPSIIDVINKDLKSSEDHKLNSSNNGEIVQKINTTLPDDSKPEISEESKAKSQPTVEQEDMLHSKYKGGQDVDELHPIKNKEQEEKKLATTEKDPKSEVSVSPTLDKKGPKLMNDTKTKSGESMLQSTTKMMAVSSSVLANTQHRQQGIIEPGKAAMTVLLTVVALLCFGAIGLLVWKRIAMRRFGRDVLINEDDFDEVADMHTFDRAQIQIT